MFSSDLKAVANERVAVGPEIEARSHRKHQSRTGVGLRDVGIVDHARHLTGHLNPPGAQVERYDLSAAGEKTKRQLQVLEC